MKECRFFKEFSDAKWDEVRNHPYFAKVRERSLAKAEEYLAKDPPYLKFSDYHKFVTEGSRKAYGTPLAQYTGRLTNYFFCYLLTGDDKYIEPLSDILWAICNLETWASNAHVKEEMSVFDRRRFLELVSCTTGFRIAEILYFVGDKLPELVYRRAMAELRFRIIDSFIEQRDENAYWWYHATNNWSAVCISRVFGAMLYVCSDEEIEREIPRCIKIAQCFIDGIPDDGCCLEGASYWNYGFSHYVLFADMLCQYTDGKINLFEDEKIKKIAEFYSHVAINSHQSVSFSDGGMNYGTSNWLSHKIKDIYPDAIIGQSLEPETDSGILRYVLWCNPKLEIPPIQPVSYHFPIAQWFIHVNENYSVAAKGGYNREPHNHNDVGSFIVSKNDEVTFCDPGGGEYVKTYFGAGRYTHLVTSARGHSVPLINGELQTTGTDKATVITMDEDRFTVDIAVGYPETVRAIMPSLLRDLDCQSDCLVITDTYTFTEEPTSVVEQFVSLKEITGGDGKIVAGDSELYYDPELLRLTIDSESFRRNNGTTCTLYRAHLEVIEPKKNMSLVFKIK